MLSRKVMPTVILLIPTLNFYPSSSPRFGQHIQAMCQQITFRLACEHVSTHIRYCAIGLSHRRACSNTTKQSIPYPPPPGYTLPKCPLADCPFEAKNQAWDCCWCGKTWNVGGRCSCVMIGEGATYRCEHICCESCMPSREYFS